MTIVVLDPGHGGFDPGALGRNTKEKDNNLSLALVVGRHLSRYGVSVNYTRTIDKAFGSDINSDLANRIIEAKKYDPDVFVSLHNNSFNKSAAGMETHCYKLGGMDEQLARAIQSQLAAAIPDMIDRGVKVSNLYVTRKFNGIHTSACLVEYGFIDSEEDMILMHLEQAASAISKGILDFLGVHYDDRDRNTGEPSKEEHQKMKNLVVYTYDEDQWAANYLALWLKCPLARYEKQTTPELLDSIETIYQVGGKKVLDRVVLISGNDEYDSVKAVLDYMGKL